MRKDGIRFSSCSFITNQNSEHKFIFQERIESFNINVIAHQQILRREKKIKEVYKCLLLYNK